LENTFESFTFVERHLRIRTMKIQPFIALLAFVAVCSADPGHNRRTFFRRPQHPRPYRTYHPAPCTTGDVVDVAVGSGSFKTLVKIVTDLNLVGTLKGAKALTIFAPTDDAFAKLPPGTLDSLTPAQAKQIILRHVVAAKVPASAVRTGKVATFGGERIKLIKTRSGGVKVKFNGGISNVVTPDVNACNGVIHVIDKVIL